MSGLVPNRKTREQLEAANREFVNRHRTYVETWIRDRQSVSEDDLNSAKCRVSRQYSAFGFGCVSGPVVPTAIVDQGHAKG